MRRASWWGLTNNPRPRYTRYPDSTAVSVLSPRVRYNSATASEGRGAILATNSFSYTNRITRRYLAQERRLAFAPGRETLPSTSARKDASRSSRSDDSTARRSADSRNRADAGIFERGARPVFRNVSRSAAVEAVDDGGGLGAERRLDGRRRRDVRRLQRVRRSDDRDRLPGSAAHWTGARVRRTAQRGGRRETRRLEARMQTAPCPPRF